MKTFALFLLVLLVILSACNSSGGQAVTPEGANQPALAPNGLPATDLPPTAAFPANSTPPGPTGAAGTPSVQVIGPTSTVVPATVPHIVTTTQTTTP